MLLKGKVAILTGIMDEIQDWASIVDWHNDEDKIRNITDDVGRFRSKEDLMRYMADAYRHPYGRLFVIRVLPSGQKKTIANSIPIGYVAATAFDYKNRKCTVTVLVAEKEDKEQKIATDALRTMCTYLNRELGIHRIETLVPQDDASAPAAFKAAGFKQEGILKDYYLYDGKYHNTLVFAWMGETH